MLSSDTARVLFVAALTCTPACEHDRPAPPEAVETGASTASAAPVSSSSAPEAMPSSSASSAPPASVCGDDMVLVQGGYCPQVEHHCLEHTADYEAAERRKRRAIAKGQTPPPNRAPERCVRFEEPGRCLSSTRTPMRFCIDRLEWPGKEGELPALLATWHQARASCEGAGKRLCTADEFNFACEGEDALPYSYGYVRDPARCNIDKPYVTPRRVLMPYEDCQESRSCADEIARLDQREPVGSRPGCTSPFGALDLNGNVNEWVERPGQAEPFRSGLKGGWWGPARSRCRPMVTAHDENYAGYEVGFRCCKDAP